MARRRRPAAVGRVLAAGAAVSTFGFAVAAMAVTQPTRAPSATPAPPAHWVFIETRHHPAPPPAAPTAAGGTPAATVSSPPPAAVARSTASPAPAPSPPTPPTVR